MTELTSVAEELVQLLADIRQSAKGKFPHVRVALFYRRYLEEEKLKLPKGKLAEIQTRFAGFFGRSLPWVSNYVALGKLPWNILKRVEERGTLRIPFMAGVRLARMPADFREEVLKNAEELAAGKSTKLEACIRKAAENLIGSRDKHGKGADQAEQGDVVKDGALPAENLKGTDSARLDRCWEELHRAFHLLNMALDIFKEVKKEVKSMRDATKGLRTSPANPSAVETVSSATITTSKVPAAPCMVSEPVRARDGVSAVPVIKKIKVRQSSEVKPIVTRGESKGGWPSYNAEKEEAKRPATGLEWPHGERVVHHAKPGRY